MLLFAGDRWAIMGPVVIWWGLKHAHGIVYSVAALFVLRDHRRRIRDHFPNLRTVSLGWLRTLVMSALVIWGIGTVQIVLQATVGDLPEFVGFSTAIVVTSRCTSLPS